MDAAKSFLFSVMILGFHSMLCFPIREFYMNVLYKELSSKTNSNLGQFSEKA